MILVPIRTGRGLNSREHWRTRAKRVRDEKWATLVAFGCLPIGSIPDIPSPCSVRLTRVAPSNGLDDDQIVGALKAVRDAIAEWLGVDDKHSDLVRYVYAQRRGPWGVEIEFGKPMQDAAFVPVEVTL